MLNEWQKLYIHAMHIFCWKTVALTERFEVFVAVKVQVVFGL
jgi:hypothetical protein